VNLRLFLSDRCNMACDYCFLSLNKAPAVVLAENAARETVGQHLARWRADARITLLGGEPLIHLDLVRAILAETAGRVPVSISTNGTLAHPDVVDELERLGARLVLSLDGGEETHDAGRRLAGSGRSSHSAILAAVGPVLPRLRVNMVVRAASSASLVRDVERLRELGIRRLSFHLDVLERWTPDSLAVLGRSLDRFERYWRTLPSGALELTHLDCYAASPSAEHGEEDDAIVGADGRRYPCDGLFSRPYGELDAWAGDEAACARARDEARREIHRLLGGEPHYTCPREPYFHALANGRDPSEAVRSYQRADRVFGAALSRLAAPAGAARA
jgi:sulfatase maturation enzyme AslB (radical SAM superfamily)